jgi:outer membrane receptor protein involved in Fe transport
MFIKSILLISASTLMYAENGLASDQEHPYETAELGAIEVIGETPLMVSGVPLSKIPSPVQTVTSQKLDTDQSLSLPDYMRWHFGSVNVNDAQNNPFQPDVQFRGFTASPLLGLPQGLAVYVNGIRFNEPFGDTVNWDLIPEGAIERMSLHSGSNPVYGLNSLGGAIAMRTKTGFTAPGHTIEVAGGSWGRHWEELTSGGHHGSFGYFLDLKNFNEDGWRDFSPTDVKQGFGTVSWQDDRSTLNLTLTANDNRLIGNGALPIQLYRQAPEAIFTHPDRTVTRLFLAALDGNTWLTDHLELSGNAYFRQNRIRTFNGDDSDFEECGEPVNQGFLCEDDEVVEDIQGHGILAGDAVDGATNNTSQTHQRSYGGSLQGALEHDLFGMKNRWVAGGSYDEGSIHFSSDTELASLTEDRGTVGSGILVDEARVRLHAQVFHHGVYLSDTLSITDQLSLTAAGRYNLSFINLEDRYGDELNGHHRFDRVNPSGGLTYALLPEFTMYGSYSESNRAPTPVELTCANPEVPCKLPNAFLSDPPLKQVVAKTWEGGFRGEISKWLGGNFHWNAGLFQTENLDDIIFISSGNLTNQGYFDNVGKTRRRGIEWGLSGDFERVRFGVNYTLLDATFRSPFLASSPNNPSADENGQIWVAKRSRIPGLPRHMVKVSTDVKIFQGLTLGANMVFNSGQFFRGDEANLNRPLDEYAVFNLHGEYRLNSHFALFTRVDNLFDQRYHTFGLYGEADDVLGEQYSDPRFIGIGAPRAGWVGVKLSL